MFLIFIIMVIGFVFLFISKVGLICEFGINVVIGVMVVYVIVIFFIIVVFFWFCVDQIIKLGKGQVFWEKFMDWVYYFILCYFSWIVLVVVVILGIVFWGIFCIMINYGIINNMLIGEKIIEDFKFFEKNLIGFCFMEFVVFVKEGYKVIDWVVMWEIVKVENYLKQYLFV